MHRRRLSSLACGLCLLASVMVTAAAQQPNTGCPAGQPAAPWPGAGFVPTFNCQGWVPANHPLAKPPAEPTPNPVTPPLPQDVEQRYIYGRIEVPATPTVSRAAGGITQLSGWAVDCVLGTFPPLIKFIEVKPDGSTREVPPGIHYQPATTRPDVQTAVRSTCPAVLNVPLADGSFGGPSVQFGWHLPLASPITELGLHTFTVIWTWPSQLHSGSASIVVNIVP
jgi:hypothetical protein